MADETVDSAKTVRWFGQTDVGRFRKDNQDSFLLLAVDGEGVKRLGKYGESLATMFVNNNSVQPSFFGNRISNGSSMNLNRVLALQRLGEADEAISILTTEQRVLTQAKNDGMRRGYHFIQAKIHLLSGEYEAGLHELDVALRNFEASWIVRKDPVLLELVGKEKLAEMTKWLDEHIDAERAKLGWPPADF